MTLPGKNSRLISIDGEVYRWAVSPDSGYSYVIVEPASGQEQRVEAHIDDPEAPLTPALAREVIREALKCGWQPNASGLKPLWLNGQPLLERVEQKTTH
ncbi:MAG: hypothetical protein AAGI37_21300 [Planctomycetota bacterium]